MKANKLFFCALSVSLLSLQVMAPADFIIHTNSFKGRMPANEQAPAKKVVAKKPAAKKAVTSKEMKDLKTKLATLEQSLKNKEDLLDQKTKEIEQLKNNRTDEKIAALTKLIEDQRSDIDKLRNDIKNSEVKDSTVAKENKAPSDIVLCKSESKGEKLEADVKKNLEDKEAVLKQIEGLKKENDGLKSEIASSKPVEKKSSENSELIALMSQMTTMFTAQMQAQMQAQAQMLSMLTQIQGTMFPQVSPYASDFSQGLAYPGYPGGNGGFNNIGIGWGGMGVGIPANSQWSAYSNPYAMPEMNRQPAQTQSDFGFTFNNREPLRGFDFTQPAVDQTLSRVKI